jgi:putative addiction module component (TIGR02574 family)
MSAQFDDLEKRALALSREEKAALVRILIDDLDARPDSEVERLWVEEARRRYDEYLRGEAQAIPGEQVMARMPDRR